MSRPSAKDVEMPNWEAAVAALEQIPALPESERTAAIEELLRFPFLGIRERARRIAAALLTDDVLVGYLRNDVDDVIRNAGLEILKLRGADTVELAITLSSDDNDEVVIQAVQLMDSLKNPCVIEALRGLLKHSNVNVVQAAITAIGHLGDPSSISDLVPFLDEDTWLQLAAIYALGDLRCAGAIEPLRPLLTDLTVGAPVIETIGRIGGEAAARALIDHWRAHGEKVDPRSLFGLIAHCLEGLSPDQKLADPGLLSDAIARFEDEDSVLRLRAARCVLAMGAGPAEEQALSVLAAGAIEKDNALPACLEGRYDLLKPMLAMPNVLRTWAILLGSNRPDRMPTSEFLSAISDPTTKVPIAETAQILAALDGIEVAASLLQLYQRVGDSDRKVLSLALVPHDKDLRSLVQRPEVDPVLRVLVLAALGDEQAAVVMSVTKLQSSSRTSLLLRLGHRSDVIEALPWRTWLRETREETSDLLPRVALCARATGLLPLLREEFANSPTIDIVRAFAALGDRESVPSLIELLGRTDANMAAAIVDALGTLGGPESRVALRMRVRGDSDQDVRFALRALANCATDEDERLFLEFAEHSDWYVRLACTEVLGRFRRADNLAALMKLCNDPVRIVAQRALALLDG